MDSFLRFMVELAQGPGNVTKDITKSDEKKLEPRPPGERSIYAEYLRNMKTHDYPRSPGLPGNNNDVKNQQRSDMPTANLPHNGFDPVIPGEKKEVKQGRSDKHIDHGDGSIGSTKRKTFGEFRAVMQGSSDIDLNKQIKEGIGDATPEEIERYKQRHRYKTKEQIRKMLHRKDIKSWQTNELRMML